MANIDGGALSFKSVMENDQMNSAIEETLRRVQGLSDATVTGGKQMDKAFMQTTESIREALGQIGQACEIHETELVRLEEQYSQLGNEASAAFLAGRDEEYRAIEETRAGIQGEIAVHKQALEEARNLSNELENEIQKREEATRQVEENANAHQSLRTRIKELREEMAMLIDQGIDEQSEAYKALVNELGRLQDIQGDIAQQGKILANDEAKFQGLIQGLSGLSGAFSAATGAISLFAGENENLQRIMTKVQSVMAIAMGMQSVAQTLNKDSAFQLVTLNGLKEWWAGIVAKATVAETAEAGATQLNTTAKEQNAVATGQAAVTETLDTAAKGANTAAATAGTTANLTLAGAFRAVGLAIKSIPVFGWIVTAIVGLVAAVSALDDVLTESDKELEKMRETLADSQKQYGKATAELAVYQDRIQSFNGDKADEKRLIEELNSKYGEAMGKYNTLSQWKDTLTEKGKVYCQTLLKEAEAQAILTKYTEAYLAVQNAKDLQADYDKKGFLAQMWDNIKNLRTGDQRAYQAEIDEAQKSADKYLDLYRKKMKEADDLKNSFDLHTPQDTTKKTKKAPKSKTTTTKKDSFIELLEKRKAEYERYKKWVNSSNEDIQKAASTEFATLLKDGSSYKKFLENLQSKISLEPQNNQTAKQLSAIRNELAELSKVTVLDAFNESLQKELDGADSVLKRLDIIAQKRNELANDGSDIDEDKKQTLDDAEKNALQKQQEETQKLLDDYASYLDKKIKLDLEYSNDLALLEKARAKATTDEERKSIDAAIANRKRQHDKDSKQSGDSDYDQMLQTYRTFEQKKEDIIEEFSEKRKKAQEHGNTEMLAQLDKAQNEALSKLAIDEMKISPDWEKMFGNLDEIGTRELERLLATIEGKTAVLGIELSPEDFKVIQDKVKELKNEIKERNPFKALTKGFEDLKKATTDDDKAAALAGMFDSAGKAGNQLKGIISDVTSTLEALGVEGTEEIEHAIQALDGLASGAQDAVMGFMSGNPVQMVGGAIKAIGSVVNFFAGANDRRAERSIKKHQENVDRLTSAYKELEWQTSKALGGDVYKHQQASIENMKQQQRELDGMIQAERSKKKTDNGKIKEWQERKKELDRAIADTMESITKNILQTDAKSAANELGDALVAAFAKGEDAAKNFDNVVNNILKNAVLNQLKKNFLEQQMNEALKGLEKSMGYWVGSGNDKKFVFDGLTDDEIARFKEQAGQAAYGFKEAMKVYDELFKDVLSDNDASLTGAVKGVTEETASIVAGQLNAMRINQGEANNMLRQQLSVLSQIAQNTSYNRHLEKLDGILSALKGQQNDPLRSQGLQQ